MFDAITNLLEVVPKPVAAAIAMLVLGGVTVGGMETRYMTVAEFTESFILDLKREIRETRKDLETMEPGPGRDLLEEQLEQLLDQLCMKAPDDPYCRGRE